MNCKRKSKKELLQHIKKNLITPKDGFIFIDTIIILPIVFCLLITMLIMAGTYIKLFINYLDMWIVQSEVRKIMEDITTEIEYADEIYYKSGSLNTRELRISTSRRAALSDNMTNNEVSKRYFSYKNEGPVLYRNDLSKLNDYVYTVTSRQPLNGENYFSTNRISFECIKLGEGLYQIEVEGYSYKQEKYFRLKTSVINRLVVIKNDSRINLRNYK